MIQYDSVVINNFVFTEKEYTTFMMIIHLVYISSSEISKSEIRKHKKLVRHSMEAIHNANHYTVAVYFATQPAGLWLESHQFWIASHWKSVRQS